MDRDRHAEVFQNFRPVTSSTSGRHIYDFIGSATRAEYKRGWAPYVLTEGRTITPGLPPKNEHYFDWIATLRAVLRAGSTFRMAELGAGWGPWMVRGALACKQVERIAAVELVGVEADPTHFVWLRQHFTDNGLDAAKHTLLNGAAAGKSGTVTFPVIDNPDEDYGSSILAASRHKRTIEVPAYDIGGLLNRFSGPIDFLHVDIQGAEYEALPAAISGLNSQVRSLMVGTHTSDSHHDTLVTTLLAAGWVEIQNLARDRTHETPWGPIKIGDGFLLFDNPRLVEPAQIR